MPPPASPGVHVVIGGAGEVGRKIAEFLSKDRHDVVLVDLDEAACDRAKRGLDILVVHGNAASAQVLEDAGIKRADVFYAVTSHDEVNLAAAAIAKSMGAKRVIARVNSLELMSQAESREFRPIGVDVAISPDLVAATKIVRLIEFPGILEMDAFEANDLRLIEARVESGSPAAGQSVADVDLPRGVNLVAIFRGAEVIIPSGADKVHRGDHVVLLLEHEDLLPGVTHAFGGTSNLTRGMGDPRHIVVAGATGIARRLATLLKRSGRRVTLVAQGDHDRIERLAGELEGVLVLEGSSRDVKVFREEGLESADLVVAASPHEEFNLITCLLARSLGVPRTAALVDQPELEDLAEHLGVDMAVSPRFAAVGTMLKYASDLDPEEMTLLHHGEAQVLVVEVEEGNEIAGKRLRDTPMPRGATVGALVRGENSIVPRGDERVEVGDQLVVFATAKAVPALSRLF